MRLGRNSFALSFSYQQAALTMTENSAKSGWTHALTGKGQCGLSYAYKMINNTTRQPKETQPLDFLGGTQNATVFCSRSHCRWEKWGLAENENSLLSVASSLWRSHSEAHDSTKMQPSRVRPVWEVRRGSPVLNRFQSRSAKTFSDLNSMPSGAGHFQLSLRKQPLWPNCLLEDVQSHFHKAIIKRLNLSILHWRYSFTGTHTYFLSASQGQEILPFSNWVSDTLNLLLADVTLSRFYSNLNVLSASFLLDLGNMTNQQI